MNKQNKPNKQGKKYRPYLSEQNIRHILSLAKADAPLSVNSKELIQLFAPMLAKIENDALVASYVANPRESMLSRLGGKEIEEAETDKQTTAESLSILRLQAYTKWDKYGAEVCSCKELELCYEYRVANNLLTPQEQAAEDESWEDVDMSKYTTLSDVEGL